MAPYSIIFFLVNFSFKATIIQKLLLKFLHFQHTKDIFPYRRRRLLHHIYYVPRHIIPNTDIIVTFEMYFKMNAVREYSGAVSFIRPVLLLISFTVQKHLTPS